MTLIPSSGKLMCYLPYSLVCSGRYGKSRFQNLAYTDMLHLPDQTNKNDWKCYSSELITLPSEQQSENVHFSHRPRRILSFSRYDWSHSVRQQRARVALFGAVRH